MWPGDARRREYAEPWDSNGRGTRRMADRAEIGATEKTEPLVGYVPVYGPVYGEGGRIREGSR